jgi:predicted GIY-YIG superfamily endonuclease
MSLLYVLKLRHNKYYVGSTNNFQQRYEDHLQGTGPAWTHDHSPVGIERLTPVTSPFDEDRVTKEYMMQYGIDNVRGGSYAQVHLSRAQRDTLMREFQGMYGACYRCGRTGHYASECPGPARRRPARAMASSTMPQSQPLWMSQSQQPCLSQSQQPWLSQSPQTRMSQSQQPQLSQTPQPQMSQSQQPHFSLSQPQFSQSQQPLYQSQQPHLSQSEQTHFSQSQQPQPSQSQQPWLSQSQHSPLSQSEQPQLSQPQQPQLSQSQQPQLNQIEQSQRSQYEHPRISQSTNPQSMATLTTTTRRATTPTTTNNTTTNTSTTTTVCYRCGYPGHVILECYARTHRNGHILSDNVYARPHAMQLSVECFRCGRPGHVIPECYARTHRNGRVLSDDGNGRPDDDGDETFIDNTDVDDAVIDVGDDVIVCDDNVDDDDDDDMDNDSYPNFEEIENSLANAVVLSQASALCGRCGRMGHTASDCYARLHRNGQALLCENNNVHSDDDNEGL